MLLLLIVAFATITTSTKQSESEMNLVTKNTEGQLVTTSLAIAEGTKVQHKNVIELVRTHSGDLAEFGVIAFQTRLNEQGKNTEYAVLNEQQSALVITYMRNSEVVKSFKKALIKGFYEMRTALQNVADPLSGLPAEHRALIAIMVDNAAIKARQDQQDATQALQQDSIKRLEAKQTAFEDGHSFFTAMGFCAMRAVKLVMSDMQRLGRLAAAYSKANNIPVDKTRDARFGLVNMYHETALENALEEIHGGM